MKRLGITALLLIAILTAGCQFDPQMNNAAAGDDGNTAKGGVHDAPGLRDYVGNGYDMLGDNIGYVGCALYKAYPDSVKFEYKGETLFNILMIEDSSDLLQMDDLEAGGGIKGAFGPVQFEGCGKYELGRKLTTSNKSITVLVMARYKYGNATLNHTAFDGDFQTMLRENKQGFYRNFGNGYSRTAELGGMVISSYTFSLKAGSVYRYEQLKAEIKAKILVIGIEGNIDIETLLKTDESHVEVKGELFASGFIPGTIPTTNDEMKKLIADFSYCMVNTFKNVDLNDLSTCYNLPCLGTIYESYESLANRLQEVSTYNCDIDEYYNKKMSWWKYYGKINRVRKDIEANTFNLPIDVINNITIQVNDTIAGISSEMDKCKNRSLDAQFAGPDLYSGLINFFRIKLQTPPVLSMVDQAHPVQLCWNNDLGLTSFAVLLDSETLPALDIRSVYYNYTPQKPGVVSWSVLGYRNNGVPVDSIQRSFIVPGFDKNSTNFPLDPIEKGTTIRFFIINMYPSGTGMTNVLCVQKASGVTERLAFPDSSTILDYTFTDPDTRYTVWVEGACNGTTGNSEEEIIVTRPEAFNWPPVLAPIGDKSVYKGMKLEFALSGSDPENAPLTYSAAQLPSGATFDPVTRLFSWTPSDLQVGFHQVIFTVSDGKTTDSEEIKIAVGSKPPVWNTIGNKTAYEGKLIEFTVTATDPDKDPLVYSVIGLPPGAIFNPATRKFSWTPVDGQAGNRVVTFLVSDGYGSVSQPVTITVWDLFIPAYKASIVGYGGASYNPATRFASCGGASGAYLGSGTVTFTMSGGTRYRAEFSIYNYGNGTFTCPAGIINTANQNVYKEFEWASGDCGITGGNGGGVNLDNLVFYRKLF
jgi:hypothetical protein